MTKTLDVSRASIRAEITTGSLTKIPGFSRASSENKVAGGLVGAASGVVAWHSRYNVATHNVATIARRENNRNLLSGKGRLPRRGRGSDRMFWSEQIVFREGGSYAKKTASGICENCWLQASHRFICCEGIGCCECIGLKSIQSISITYGSVSPKSPESMRSGQKQPAYSFHDPWHV